MIPISAPAERGEWPGFRQGSEGRARTPRLSWPERPLRERPVRFPASATRAALVLLNFLTCAAVCIGFHVSGGASVPGAEAALVTTFLRFAFACRQRPMDFVLSIAFVYLFWIPAAVYRLHGEGACIFVMALASMAFDMMLCCHPGRRAPSAPCVRLSPALLSLWWGLILLCAAGPLVLPAGGWMVLLRFSVPFAVSLLILERAARGEGRRFTLMLAVTLLTVAAYVTFFWSGFGRLLIGSYILMPLLIAACHDRLPFRPWQAVLVSPLALYLAYWSRSGAASVESVMSGGAGDHLVITMNEFRRMGTDDPARAEFAGQWLLWFLNWFPRNLWPEKPVGLGHLYVDVVIGRQGLAPGHSVSVGFIGEQVYLLGGWFLAGLLLVLLTIIGTRGFLAAFTGSNIAVLVVFDVSLLSYVWGGFGAFGSRAWLMLLPMLACLPVVRLAARAPAPARAGRWSPGRGGQAANPPPVLRAAP